MFFSFIYVSSKNHLGFCIRFLSVRHASKQGIGDGVAVGSISYGLFNDSAIKLK